MIFEFKFKNKRWLISLLIVLFAMTLNGCVSDETPLDDEDDSLVRCKNCKQLHAWLIKTAEYKMRSEIKANRSWYGDDGMAGGGGWDEDNSAPPTDDDAGVSDDDSAGDDDSEQSGDDSNSGDDDDSDHSDTNVQEEGVDEADIIKTDGSRLFVLSGNYLLLFDPNPGPATHEISRIEIAGHPLEMFINNDVILVYSSMSNHSVPDDIWQGIPREELAYQILKLTIIDYSDQDNPALVREAYMEGSYVSSRKIGGAARIVIFSEPNMPDFDTWVDEDEFCNWNTGYCDEEAMDKAYEMLEGENADKIEDQAFEDWLPRYHEVVYDSTGQGTHQDSLFAECQNHFHPVDPRGCGFLTVMTVLMTDPAVKQPDIALVAEAGIVYASTSSLVVAESADMAWDWQWESEWNVSGGSSSVVRSAVHLFDIATNEQAAIYKASGSVRGFILNQFSMSEKDGYLRLATTSGWWEENLTNAVYILGQNGVDLRVVGSIKNIAPGEQIYSARFMGNKGYLVTFFQTDPLFTLDLTDPTAPFLVGELEIPGFSSYIHPMDENHLLTIGETGDEWGSTGGVSLQIFDVSDFANPTQLHSYQVGEWWSGNSEAQYNHKAFLYYNHPTLDLDLLVIPITYYDWYDYGYDDDDDDFIDDDDDLPGKGTQPMDLDTDFGITGNFSGFIAFNCNATVGFTDPLMAVDHTSLEPEAGSDEMWNYLPYPLRSAVIGEYLFTLSEAALVVTSLSDQTSSDPIPLPYSNFWEEDYYGWDDGEEGVPDEEEPDVPPETN